jgi:hypothetical protein
VSVIFGHVHRIESKFKTRRHREGPKRSFAHTPGCLARIDGAVSLIMALGISSSESHGNTDEPTLMVL